MSAKLPDFESPEYDNADIIKEDARVDAWEAQLNADRAQQQGVALHTAAVDEAVSWCLDSCLECLDVLYLQRDAQPFTEVAVAHNSWQQEDEPEPCSRDAWLRGALPDTVVPARVPSASPSTHAAARSSAGKEQRVRPGSGLLAGSRKGPGSVASSVADDAAGSPAQHRTQQSRRTSIAQSESHVAAAATGSRPGTSASTARPGSSTARRPSTGTAGSTAAKSRPSTAQQHAAAASTTAGDSTAAAAVDSAASPAGASSTAPAQTAAAARAAGAGRKQATRASNLPQEQQEAEDRLRQELQLRRQQEAVVKELKQKDDAARAALLNMQKDLKGTRSSRGGCAVFWSMCNMVVALFDWCIPVCAPAVFLSNCSPLIPALGNTCCS